MQREASRATIVFLAQTYDIYLPGNIGEIDGSTSPFHDTESTKHA